ncbi:MAG TPA: sulfatase-like hydrolase/transferase [Solirubrobacterales bacterium]|nr:sulfatase-like hydrolase/transferase [Solirubrobacterales bacterium]
MGGGHLAALWALAVIQPLLSLLGSNPDFFVARDNTGGQIIIFVLAVTLLPPLVATSIEALLNLISDRARWAFHLVLVALLFAILALQFLKQLADGPAVPMIIGAIAAGIGLAWAYRQRGFLRSLTDILIPAPLIILIAFFFFSDASELTSSSGEVEAIKTSIEKPAPVVMLVFDEFPSGSLMTEGRKINAARFPNFAELQSGASWYRNTVTDASYTAIAVPSILTGQDADRDRLPTAADYPESIFTLLGDSYRVRAVEPITQLCPPSICPVADTDQVGTGEAVKDLFSDLKYVSAHLALPESMSSSLPDISQNFEGFGGNPEESVERGRARQFVRDRLDAGESTGDGESAVDRMLAARRPGDGPTFDFAHIEEPHYPWTHYPDGRRYSETTEDFRGFFDETEWKDDGYVTERARQAHLNEVGFADHLLGRIMDRIKRDGKWDETMIVVAADHGGAMVKGLHRREAREETLGQIGMVPLFIKAPGQRRGHTVDRPTCVSEILPIMARDLGVEVPWETATCDRTEVKIDNGTGPMVTAPISTVLAQRDAYIAQMADLFGDETGFSRVLKLGPDEDLIGRPLESLEVGSPAPGASAAPDTGGDLGTDFRPETPFNPVLRQRGTLDGIEEETPLAVSVNGRIAAVGQSYRDGSQIRYSILLPESSLREGRNEISLYTVETDGGKRLIPIG